MDTSEIKFRRHPPQLHRQMEQEDTSLQPSAENRSVSFSKHEANEDELSAKPNGGEANQVHQSQSTSRHHLPRAQDSQGSSSTGSGAMSLGTSGGSVSSGKSSRQSGKPTGTSRGTRCSSSTSSSTEETEARERHFGSLDLHPLPSVAPAAGMSSVVRRSLIGSTAQCLHLHYNALVTMHQRFSSHAESSTNTSGCHSSQPSVPTATVSPECPRSEMEPATSSVASLSKKPENESNEGVPESLLPPHHNPMHLFGVLPPCLWPRLLCPLHGASLADSSSLLIAEKDQEAAMVASCKDEPTSGSYDRTLPILDLNTVREQVNQDIVTGTRNVVHNVAASCTPGSESPNVPISAIADKWFETSTKNSHPAPHIGPYQLGPTLGRGNFAVVKLAKHIPTKMKVAIKIMNKELIGPNNLNKITRELEAMKRCQHPHIVRLYHVMETESSIFMVTEYASKGEVFDHISISRAFSEKEARELFWQIVCAIDFCHNSGVVHRDLKAENLLLDSEFKIKVADFGFCNFFKPDEFLSTHCGSPQYAAPELFKGEPYDGPLADVWSLGVILYILVCGSFPFPGESLGDIRSQVLRGLVRFPFFLSTACEQVIRCMLQVDPVRRFRLRQVTATQWMQASPNVEHYRAMMSRYETKAKERQFDELFRNQYPEHSELARAHRVEQAQNQLDNGVLRALAIGVGFEEEQIRFSSLQNKCDRWHATYQLLCAKIRRFRTDPHLSQYVDEAMRSVGVPTLGRRRRSSLLNAWRSTTGQVVTSTCGATLGLTSSGAPDSLMGSDETEGTCLRRSTLLATVPDVMDEYMAEAEAEREDEAKLHHDPVSDRHAASSELTMKSTKRATSDVEAKRWKDPHQPNSTDLNVALFILKADEDFILSRLGVAPTASINPNGVSTVRRHTVQLAASPLTALRPPPPTEALVRTVTTRSDRSSEPTQTEISGASDVDGVSMTTSTDEKHSLEGGVRLDDSGMVGPGLIQISDQRAVHRFPRQITQPHIGTYQQIKSKALQPEQLLRTALDWLPCPWGSNLQAKNTANSEVSTQMSKATNKSQIAAASTGLSAKTLPSLELGDEASTAGKPPGELRRVRPGLQRRNSVHPCEDELDASEPTAQQSVSVEKEEDNGNDLGQLSALERRILAQSTLDNTPAFVASAGQCSYDVNAAQETILNLSYWTPMVQDSIDFGRRLSVRSEPEDRETTNVPVAMETDGPEGTLENPEVTMLPCWSAVPVESGDTRSADEDPCDSATHLGTLLPQLNLPANLPAMIHQPVARFTVKDPHLLAPPDFMTPHCSSFPRRSSDGAAELQPLHRPALAVGGSYPEQTNYRNMHDSADDASMALVAPPAGVCCAHDVCTTGLQPNETATASDGSESATTILKSCDPCMTPVSNSTTANVGLSNNPGTCVMRSARKLTVPETEVPGPVHARATLRAVHPVNSRVHSTTVSNAAGRSPVTLSARQHSMLSYTQPATMDRTLWRLLRRRQPTIDSVAVGESGSVMRAQSTAVQAQIARHRKRFSLPSGYRPVRQAVHAGMQSSLCLCNHPLTPDLIQYIQHLTLNPQLAYQPPLWTGNPAVSSPDQPACSTETGFTRRGSEASQLLAWKNRLNQCGGLFEPTVPEPILGQLLRPVAQHVLVPNQKPAYSTAVEENCAHPSSAMNSSPVHLPVTADANTNLSKAPALPGTLGVQSELAQLSMASSFSPSSPSGIELDDLKTELHKLESEAFVAPVSRLPASVTADEDGGNGLNSPASSLTSSFSTNIGGNDGECHFLIVNRQYQRSTESSVSPPRVSSVSSTATRTPRANLTSTDLLREQRRWVPHRVSSLKVPRRASSAVAGSTGRGHSVRRSPNGNLTPLPGLTDHTLFEDETVECGLARRYRYSVGESLDHALIGINSELTCPSMVQPDTPPFAPLSCQPSVTGLHSQPGHHRTIVSTLSNPDHPLSAHMDAVLSSAGSGYPEEPNRTALSSPGPAGPMTILDLSPSRCAAQTQQSGSEIEGEPSSVVVGPSSVGLKRRLLAPLHGKSGDYLRTLQRTGGSLDRRLNLELFNSPKRKVYQEWLPKVAAFSRKAATTMLHAVHPSAEVHQLSPSSLSPSAQTPGDPTTPPTHVPLTPVSTCPGTSATGPNSLHFSSAMAPQISPSMSLSKLSASSLSHEVDQLPENLCTTESNIAHIDESAKADLVVQRINSDEEYDEGDDNDDENQDDEDDYANEEEEEEKHCALAPLQSHLTINMAYSHSARTRYNLAQVAAPSGLGPTSFLLDSNLTLCSTSPQSFGIFGRHQGPNPLLSNPTPLSFPLNPAFGANYLGCNPLSGASVHSIPAPVNTSTIYGITDNPHCTASTTAAAAAAASLMLLRHGDDDEDLAEIDRVNLRLAMGKLNDYINPGTCMPSETSTTTTVPRHFGQSETLPSMCSDPETLPESVERE